MSNEETLREGGDILEPLTAYKTQYESTFRTNCEEYFDGLVKASGVDLEENRATVQRYEAQSRLVGESESALRRLGLRRALLVVAIVLGAVALIVAVALFVQENWVYGSVFAAVGAAAVAIPPVVIAKAIVPRIRKVRAEKAVQAEKAGELLQLARKQTAPLNALFEDGVAKKLIEKTVPLIRLDRYFAPRRYDYLNGKYGYRESGDPERSNVGVLSGEIVGNPFVVTRELVHTMGSCTYRGSIVISWETYERDAEGNTVTVHHSETLTATVTRPKPYYRHVTRLVYGNEAAPDLHFSRKPSHAEDLSESARASKVKRGAKKLRKKQEGAVENGGSFTAMGNEEFDVLFGASDRDNEVQFRLLFTPLAQRNLLALMTDESGYGDDFYLQKSGCLNYVMSEHSAAWDMDESREKYRSYSVDDARRRFLAFQCGYFRSLYFDLAPLLSIPLYQQQKPHEYLYRDTGPRHFAVQETECAVNRVDPIAFTPPGAETPSILKTDFLSADGGSDRIRVTASAYRTEPRTEFVSVFGGDGSYHNVPVDWTEYIPVRAERIAVMKELGLTDREFAREASLGRFKEPLSRYGRAYGYGHGILCCAVPEGDSGFDAYFTIEEKGQEE